MDPSQRHTCLLLKKWFPAVVVWGSSGEKNSWQMDEGPVAPLICGLPAKVSLMAEPGVFPEYLLSVCTLLILGITQLIRRYPRSMVQLGHFWDRDGARIRCGPGTGKQARGPLSSHPRGTSALSLLSVTLGVPSHQGNR